MGRRGGFRDPNRDRGPLFERALEAAGVDPAKAPSAQAEADAPQSVTELTRGIRTLLEGHFPSVWVEGEASNLSRPRSGHVYFTLKDDRAAIGCVVWRSSAGRLPQEFADGMKVTVRGRIAVYEPQGRYQIICDSVRAAGIGELQRRFEELVAKLRAEGLFDPERKRPLPNYPRTIGIVTSPTGAAVRDMLRILRRRLPGVRIVLAPCRVQGAGSAEEVAASVARLNAGGLCDLLLVGRGGGSLEDLWAFNEEVVARAVAESRTPVISAVGHETDLTICDLVADLRAATPSEAAEAAVPVADEVATALRGLLRRLNAALRGRLGVEALRVRNLMERPVLRDPRTTVLLRAQRVDELAARARRGVEGAIARDRDRMGLAAARLEAMSPLAVLGRGYSMTWDAGKMSLVRSADEVTIGDELETRLARGRIRSQVTAVEPGGENDGAVEHGPQEED
jgi:exodeoxyribonuclease VII large subunit